MKKILSISVIGFLLFASCMVYNPDYSDALESTPTKKAKSQTEEIEPAKEEEPEIEELTEEPTDPVVEEPAGEPTDPVIEEPAEPDKPKTVDWRKFYTRVEKKAREKYNKLPWNELAREAHIPLASWMTSASCCVASHPSEDVIRKIAEVLDTSYEWLLYGEE